MPHSLLTLLCCPPPKTSRSAIAFLLIALHIGGSALVNSAENDPPAVSSSADSLAPPEPESMQMLFQGENLDGWEGDPRLWSVRDGVIHGETTAENRATGNTFLIWKDKQIADFELRLSFRCNATNNSGIQYRSKHITEGNPPNPWVVRGYQHEVRNELKFPNVSGFIYDEGGKRGRLCLAGEKAVWTKDGSQFLETLITEAEFQQLFRLDDWNDVVIIAEANTITHYLNGRKILEFTDEDTDRQLLQGAIALQLHAGAPMWAEFKNIRLAKKSPAQSDPQ